MKVYTEDKNGFKPFSITIEFETQSDLNAMFSVVSRSSEAIYLESKKSSESKDFDMIDWMHVSTQIYKALKGKL